jgi:ribonuclease Z
MFLFHRKDEYFLMDCGEGTLLQMYQMYGLEKTQHILRNLKGVFITHLHFDHHGVSHLIKFLLKVDWQEKTSIFP